MLRPSYLAVALAVILLPPVASQSLVGDDLPSSSRSEENHCVTDCSQELIRPVCGTDGKTYPSRCELQRKICEGSSVQLKHRGPCTEEISCLDERNKAVTNARHQNQNVFIPECREDGGFATVQCHTAAGFCWCVNEFGKPIPGSSVRHKKPPCHKLNKKRNGCSAAEKSLFKENLLKIFRSEFNRLPSSSTPTAAKDHALHDSHAIEWKFKELDRNGDDLLDKKELQAFKRMLKKIMKPKVCARNFTTYCDQNNDKYISRQEWSICLGIGPKKKSTEASDEEETLGSHKGTPREALPVWNKFTTLAAQVRPTDTNVDDTEEEVNDCLADRKAVLEDDVSENKQFVPECTPDGKYAKVQCFKPRGYCWCVDQETGKTISGKWALNSKPDCNKEIVRERPLKGCPDKKKAGFLNELVEYILNEYISTNKSIKDLTKDSSLTSPETKINSAKRKFQLLDSNSNQVIDKKEWKDFKNEIKKKKTMRKCGRNFLKYCDSNNDKKVTLDEWITCLGVKGAKSKKPETNPLIKYLN